ncbi:MAG: OmpA family protein [Nitrospirota bacterium]
MNTRCKHTPMVLVLTAVLVSGCVSKGRYRALESQGAAERATLQQQVAALDGQRKELESQKSTLEEELAVQRAEKQRVEQELATLNERLAVVERQAQITSAQKDEEIKRLKGTYDSLVKDLEGEIKKGEIKVTQIRDRLSVNLVEKVLFDSGRAEIKPAGKGVLKKVGDILKTVTDKQIRIEGSTDNVPIGEKLRERFPTNWELSTQRATNVLRFLEEAGVAGAQLAAVGYGPYRPIASNDTPEGRAENRRIEIVLVPADVQEVLKELE